MKKLARFLIEVGKDHPDLREDLRPILDVITASEEAETKKLTITGDTSESEMEKVISDYEFLEGLTAYVNGTGEGVTIELKGEGAGKASKTLEEQLSSAGYDVK